MYDIRPFIQTVKQIVDRHALSKPGEYARWIEQDAKGSRDLGSTPYGCANAVNILYTIGELPASLSGKQVFVDVLQNFQNKENGLFENTGNYQTHTTAFLSGALYLLGAAPLYKADGFRKYLDKKELYALLNGIDWAKEPWLGSHIGAGIYASMVLTGTADDAWEDQYFDWLRDNADPETGLWKRDCLKGAPGFHYLAASFHYVFNHEYAKRPLPYAGELLDTCIRAYEQGECIDFATEMGWADIDYAYLLARVQRRAGTRYEETRRILEKIADGLITQLMNMDALTNERLNDLNTLFAIVSALAVLQDALPGYIRTSKPLKLVLDVRPFV